MPTLENDRLVFRFPHIEPDARFAIDFQRTLRIPDSAKTYPLPPGFGSFPLRHVEDFAEKLGQPTAARGGVILPMWQAEAMWLHFKSRCGFGGLRLPVAIKVAAGKINAVTGETWRAGLHGAPQDYLVSPPQPWLDGFAIEPGVIRQFVAMPLGEGYSVEEQLTGSAEWGGIQISVTPLKAEIWHELRQAWEQSENETFRVCSSVVDEASTTFAGAVAPMGLAAGGRMRQVVHPDEFGTEAWDMAAADRVFVTLVPATDWKRITGNAAPEHPPTAQDYSRARLPWFDFYGKDQAALPGGKNLANIKSAAPLFKQFTGATLPNASDVETGKPTPLAPIPRAQRPVRTSASWED